MQKIKKLFSEKDFEANFDKFLEQEKIQKKEPKPLRVFLIL